MVVVPITGPVVELVVTVAVPTFVRVDVPAAGVLPPAVGSEAVAVQVVVALPLLVHVLAPVGAPLSTVMVSKAGVTFVVVVPTVVRVAGAATPLVVTTTLFCVVA